MLPMRTHIGLVHDAVGVWVALKAFSAEKLNILSFLRLFLPESALCRWMTFQRLDQLLSSVLDFFCLFQAFLIHFSFQSFLQLHYF